MKFLASSLILYLSLLLDDLSVLPAQAIRIQGKRKPWLGGVGLDLPSKGGRRELGKREPMSSDLKNTGDIDYYTNVTLGGNVFSVLIDTGSTDLAVAGDIPGAKDTGKSTKVQYAVGIVSGPIQTAQMEFQGFAVQDQAFILDTSGDHKPGEGIVGLGPSSASSVRDVLNGVAGDPVLDRIFRTNTSTPNFLTILLGRSQDPSDLFPGDLTVGAVLDGFENVTSQPKLPVFEVKGGGGQHWQTLLDVDGIIGPDGQPVKVTSNVKGSDKNRLNAIFDSGFSLPQVPKAVADAFYARVPGAQLQNITGITGPVYSLPCDVELNVTFKIGNISYPIHPLDTSIGTLGKTDALGNTICIGAFQPILSSALSPTYDMILGMAFLRNAYMLINFGDFVDGASSKTANPYIQLLPLTNDTTETHEDFVKIRLDGIDNTANFQLLPATVIPPSSSNDNNSNNESFSDKIHPYIPYIIAGSATAGVILLIAIAFCIRSSRRARYRRLHDPAPQGLHHHDQPPFAQYQPQRRY